jgi:hypothetical protein
MVLVRGLTRSQRYRLPQGLQLTDMRARSARYPELLGHLR